MGGLLGSKEINRAQKKIDELRARLDVKEQDNVFWTENERQLLELCIELLEAIKLTRLELLNR